MRHYLLFIATLITLSASAQQISIEEYRYDVEQYSWQIRQASEQSRIATHNLLISRTNFLPRLSLSGDFSLSLRDRSEVKPWHFTLKPEIVSTIYEGGAQRADFRLSKLKQSSTLYDEQATIRDVRYSADYAYWRLSANTLYLLATSRYVELIRSLKLIIERRFEEGYISKSDVLMIESRLSTAEYERITAEENYLQSLHNFNIMRGVESDRKVELLNSILDSLMMPQRLSIEDIVTHNPEFNSSRVAIEQAIESLKIERASFNPRVEIGINGIWQPKSPNARGTTYLDGALFARLTIPIFHFRERRHRVDAAQAKIRSREWALGELYDEILLEERDSWSALEESLSQIVSTEKSLKLAAENLELSTYSYEQGITTILDVMQAQLNWIQLYTNAITAHFNFAVARSSYERISLQYH